MFAFAIWDTHERVLFVARDPFGIKPLFVAEGPAGIAFASEKKSLLELAPALGLGNVDRDLDAAALQHYLLLQYVPEPATLHRSVRRIESGCSFTVRPGGEVEQERYFTPAVHRDRTHRAAAATAVADVLRDSVAKHMRADVTVGAFLSGGIDSTASRRWPRSTTRTSSRSPRASSARATRRSTWPPSRRRDRGPARHPHRSSRTR
jgi:asparagine synthase (glutamine-hydrolysing)